MLNSEYVCAGTAVAFHRSVEIYEKNKKQTKCACGYKCIRFRSSIDSCVEIFMECFVFGWLISFCGIIFSFAHLDVMSLCAAACVPLHKLECWFFSLVGVYFELICCWFSSLTPENAFNVNIHMNMLTARNAKQTFTKRKDSKRHCVCVWNPVDRVDDITFFSRNVT